ncbi:MAG: hypothetical protein JKY09_06990 [Crocinitomicaceae bacterium]|nr:hypothetical protein [Crocinitomicaceae bacterium]
MARIYQHILKDIRTDFRVVYGMDGYDEITLTDNTRVLGKHVDAIVNHETFSINPVHPSKLFAGATVQDAAKLMRQILSGQGTPAQNQVVAANVASALQLYEPNAELVDLYNASIDFIEKGAAIQLLNFN